MEAYVSTEVSHFDDHNVCRPSSLDFRGVSFSAEPGSVSNTPLSGDSDLSEASHEESHYAIPKTSSIDQAILNNEKCGPKKLCDNGVASSGFKSRMKKRASERDAEGHVTLDKRFLRALILYVRETKARLDDNERKLQEMENTLAAFKKKHDQQMRTMVKTLIAINTGSSSVTSHMDIFSFDDVKDFTCSSEIASDKTIINKINSNATKTQAALLSEQQVNEKKKSDQVFPIKQQCREDAEIRHDKQEDNIEQRRDGDSLPTLDAFKTPTLSDDGKAYTARSVETLDSEQGARSEDIVTHESDLPSSASDNGCIVSVKLGSDETAKFKVKSVDVESCKNEYGITFVTQMPVDSQAFVCGSSAAIVTSQSVDDDKKENNEAQVESGQNEFGILQQEEAKLMSSSIPEKNNAAGQCLLKINSSSAEVFQLDSVSTIPSGKTQLKFPSNPTLKFTRSTNPVRRTMSLDAILYPAHQVIRNVNYSTGKVKSTPYRASLKMVNKSASFSQSNGCLRINHRKEDAFQETQEEDKVFTKDSGYFLDDVMMQQAEMSKFEDGLSLDEAPPKPNRPGFPILSGQEDSSPTQPASASTEERIPNLPHTPHFNFMTPEELKRLEAQRELEREKQRKAELERRINEQKEQAPKDDEWIRDQEMNHAFPPSPNSVNNKDPNYTYHSSDDVRRSKASGIASQSKADCEDSKSAPTMKLDREGDDVYRGTMDVVKSVLRTNSDVMDATTDQIFNFVKVIGQALKSLSASVDRELNSLPENFHREIDMAQKTTNKDLSQIINQLKLLKKFVDTTQAGHYKKCLMAANQVLAMDVKNLLDVVDKARFCKIQYGHSSAASCAVST